MLGYIYIYNEHAHTYSKQCINLRSITHMYILYIIAKVNVQLHTQGHSKYCRNLRWTTCT